MPLPDRKNKARRGQSLARNWRDVLSGEVKKAERLFILGIGNRQKADDGAGSACVRLLQQGIKKRIIPRAARISRTWGSATKKRRPSPFLQIFDAGEVPESATGIIRAFHPTHVLIIDAAVGGHKPGTIFVLNKRKISLDDLSTHRIPLSFLVRYLEESIGCRVILIGIEPKHVSWRKTMTPAVRKSVRFFAEELLGILERQRSILPLIS